MTAQIFESKTSGQSKKGLGWITLGAIVLSLLTPAGSADAKPKFLRKKKDKEQAKIAARKTFEAKDTWEAYLKDENGNPYQLQLPMEKNEDEEWMTLEFTEYQGNKTRIAIMEVLDQVGQETTSTIEHRFGIKITQNSSSAPLSNIEEMLTSAIFNTNRFDVIEREEISRVLDEQDFGESGRVTAESAAKIGRILGADYVLFSSVNEWTPKKKSKGVGGVWGKSVSEVAMSFRMVDTETSRVEFAESVRATADKSSLKIPFFGREEASPINYAIVSCLNKAAYQLAKDLKVKAWKGSVAAIQGDLVTLNGGENRGLKTGMEFRALRKGPEIRDPMSGEILGHQEEVIGTIRVTSVKEKWATAVVAEGCEGLAEGDFVEPVDSAR